MGLDEKIMKQYQLLCEKDTVDKDVVDELEQMASDEVKIEDDFYR